MVEERPCGSSPPTLCSQFPARLAPVSRTQPQLVLCSASSVPQSVFTITEKAPTRAFSWLKAFTFKTLLRHYAKWALTPR